MAFNADKPATTDNYSTEFVPNIKSNIAGLAMWLDSTYVSLTGALQTGFKRYNRSTGRIEEWSGSAWGNLGLNVTGADAASTFNGLSTSGEAVSGSSFQPLIVNSSGGGAAKMTFHRNGLYVMHLGLDTDNQLKIGGGSMGVVSYRVMLENIATTYAVNISGTAKTLSSNRANWSTNGAGASVVGQLGWGNYGNNHTIFDASAGLSPTGTAISTTNPSSPWTGSYPTLMGWNGANTHGVRVDSARVSDSTTGNAATATNASGNQFVTPGIGAGVENILGVNCNGYQIAYLFNSTSGWGLYSPTGGTMANFDRVSGTFHFYGNATTATNATSASNATTQSPGNNTTAIATTAFVSAAVAAAPSLGVGQTVQDFTASRVMGQTYTNNTGRPIFVMINCTNGAAPYVLVGSVRVGRITAATSCISFLVPAGADYSTDQSGGTVISWAELRT